MRRLIAFATVAMLAVGTLLVLARTAGAGARQAAAVVYTASGARIATVQMVQSQGYVTVTVSSTRGVSPGFHGFHVHEFGVCDPKATNPDGGVTPFLSAGGHLKDDGQSHPGHAGDLPSLLALQSTNQTMQFRTDRFTVDELLEGDGASIIVHAGPDDFTNPATGNAGARFGCGVLKARR